MESFAMCFRSLLRVRARFPCSSIPSTLFCEINQTTNLSSLSTSPFHTITNPPQTLLQHPEVLHRVLEEVPLLEAFDGFKELKEGGRRLSAEEVRVYMYGWVV